MVSGIELSDEMAAVARQRTEAQNWSNVQVIVGDASNARLPSDVDAILFFLTHDLTRTPAVVERAVGAGQPGARVVAFGPVRATHPFAAPVNAVVRAISRPYVTTFEGFDAPWSYLAAHLCDLDITRTMFGGAYIATGTRAQPGSKRKSD